MVNVEIIYIKSDGITIEMSLHLPLGTTVAQALQASNILQDYPETQQLPVGIFSKKCQPHTVLKPGDRIEIYRALLNDPKERRRQRAKIQQ